MDVSKDGREQSNIEHISDDPGRQAQHNALHANRKNIEKFFVNTWNLSFGKPMLRLEQQCTRIEASRLLADEISSIPIEGLRLLLATYKCYGLMVQIGYQQTSHG